MYVLLFLFWIILNGGLTLEILLPGAVLVALLGVLMAVLFDYTPKKDFRFLRRVPVFFMYVFVLLFEILKANLQVMRFILSRKEDRLSPALVTFRPGLTTRFGRFVLANSITLTPGTITVQVDGDDFTVHCLTREILDTSENSVLVRWVRRMEA